MTDGQEVQCHNCGYNWTYTGSLQLAGCPNCGLKTPVETEAEA
jgi:predicted  nucleic acid-binding Zn-ribbon protein